MELKKKQTGLALNWRRHTLTVRECHVQSNQLRKCELCNKPHGLVQYKHTLNNALQISYILWEVKLYQPIGQLILQFLYAGVSILSSNIGHVLLI